jgi:hypothetical protein
MVREAEQRKKRKVQLALAASVMALMLGGGAFAFWRNEQAQRYSYRARKLLPSLKNQLGTVLF